MLTLHAQDNKTFLLLCKSLEDPKFFAFFFGKKKGLQKFRGKFYVLAALWNCVLSRRFGNPLQKFFCGFGFVEFLMRSAPLPKGVWGQFCARVCQVFGEHSWHVDFVPACFLVLAAHRGSAR
jgi:hypothetical protein